MDRITICSSGATKLSQASQFGFFTAKRKGGVFQYDDCGS
jgi:hypothetical protein